jgi:hypothetical protein
MIWKKAKPNPVASFVVPLGGAVLDSTALATFWLVHITRFKRLKGYVIRGVAA